MSCRECTFENWQSIEISSGNFRLIVPVEIGPRILGGFLGNSANIFYVDPERAGKKGGDDWHLYGGHRLWHAPEAKPRSYTRDNAPVKIEQTNGALKISQPADDLGLLAKSIEILPLGNEKFEVIHTVTSMSHWPIEVAAWALSVMAPGGVGVFPLPVRATELLPNGSFAVWPYNTMGDGRISFGNKYFFVRHDASCANPNKIGYSCEAGRFAYVNNGVIVERSFAVEPGAKYPDFGCSAECYTCPAMQEMESISALRVLEFGESIVHKELWHARTGTLEACSDEAADRIFA